MPANPKPKADRRRANILGSVPPRVVFASLSFWDPLNLSIEFFEYTQPGGPGTSLQPVQVPVRNIGWPEVSDSSGTQFCNNL
jgi:hypothetical protein